MLIRKGMLTIQPLTCCHGMKLTASSSKPPNVIVLWNVRVRRPATTIATNQLIWPPAHLSPIQHTFKRLLRTHEPWEYRRGIEPVYRTPLGFTLIFVIVYIAWWTRTKTIKVCSRSAAASDWMPIRDEESNPKPGDKLMIDYTDFEEVERTQRGLFIEPEWTKIVVKPLGPLEDYNNETNKRKKMRSGA